MKLVGNDIAKYEHDAYIMELLLTNPYAIPFYSSKTIKKDFKNSITN